MTTSFVTDTDYLAAVLADGEWHQLERIIGQSQRDRGHGFTVHSRAADLRKRGHTVEQRSERNGRRITSYYRLVDSLEEPSPAEGSSSEAVDHGSPSPPSSDAVSLCLFDDAQAAA